MVALAVTFLWAGAALAAFDAGLIAISFGGNDATVSGKAVVGSDGDRWNAPEGQEGSDIAMKGVKGTKTDVRLTFDADRTYDAKEQSPFSGGPYENLMRHYLVATQSRKVALTGLTPKAGYCLYLYSASDGGGDGRETSFTVGGRTKSAIFSKDKSEFTADVNYVRFPVVADDDGKVTIAYASERGEANLNGIQIVPAKAAGAIASEMPRKAPGTSNRTARSETADTVVGPSPSRKTKPKTLASRHPAAAAAGDWPYWLGSNHDGKSPDTGLLKQWPEDGPKLLWKADDIGVGFSSVAVAGGKVYITGDQDGKLMLSPSTWTASSFGRRIAASAAAAPTAPAPRP